MPTTRLLSLCPAAVILGALPVVSPAQPLPAPGACTPSVSWTELRFQARKLLLKATATVSVATVPAPRVVADLRTPPEGGGRPPGGPCVAVVTLESDVPVGRDERATAWLDAVDGGVLQVDKVAAGRSPFRKVFRYGDSGFFVWRSAPADRSEAALDPSGWSRRKTTTVTSPLPEDGGVLTDSYALLYQISLVPADRGEVTRRALMYADDRLAEVRFRAGGLSLRDVDYVEARPDGEVRRRGKRLLRRLSVGAAPVGAATETADVDLGLLGMKGELTVWIDVETGVPVELDGRTDAVGRLQVTVERATLFASPRPGGDGGG